MSKDKIVIITDMDGCLLDYTYDYRKSINAINYIVKNNILLVLNSSKTKYEIEYYIEKWRLDNSVIFIPENGAAVYIPRRPTNKYLAMIRSLEDFEKVVINDYYIIVNGLRIDVIEQRISDIIEKTHGNFIWLRDFTPENFSELTGLPVELAKLALKREYSYLFHPLIRGSAVERVVHDIKSRGLHVATGSGVIYIITGMHDKGLATKQVINILKKAFKENIITIGVGDGFNDIPMLSITDYSILLNCRKELVQQLIGKKNLFISCKKGPNEWLSTVKKIVNIALAKQ